MKSKIKKIVYATLAFLFTGLGLIGVFLPILPTTPLLLLASFFFAKSSERFYQWFVNTDLYKKHLQDFVETRAMTVQKKLTILLPVSLMLIITYVMVPIIHARILILAVIALKYWYFIFRIKTIKFDK